VPDDILAVIQEELRRSADEKTRSSFHRFFREPVSCHGVKTPVVREIARRYFRKLGQVDKRAVFTLCEELLMSDYCEEAFIASDWAYRLREMYGPGDIRVFEAWIGKYVNNWAKCDTLCNHAVGSLIEQFPVLIGDLKAWTGSENRWLRRASAVSLVLPARKGKFLEDILEISDRLLHDEDDLVQKGYGWMLKEAGRRHQKEIFDYVMKHRAAMPRTALRYAIEKMPPDLKDRAMRSSKKGSRKSPPHFLR
jgi:3-methyladenine DNA glycosylase AlkD